MQIKTLALTGILILLAWMAGCFSEPKEPFSFKSLPGAQKERAPAETTPRALDVSTDIHYNERYCLECHEERPSGGNTFLKYGGDFKQLCWCHYDNPGIHIHPVDIEPSPALSDTMPENFPLQDGRVSCNTCHDIFSQCQVEQRIFTEEQNFLRGAPYQSRTDICFKCHDENQYSMYNPHQQIDDQGEIIKATCLYCHSEVPDPDSATYENVDLLANLDMLCIRCHSILRGGALHIRHFRSIPTPKILTRIQEMKDRYNIALILNEEGRVTCATCHNPHEKLATPADRVGVRKLGAEEGFGTRVGSTCSFCHPL